MRIINMLWYLIKGCLDRGLSLLTSKQVMHENGWIFDVAESMPFRYTAKCSKNSWFGFTGDNPVGFVSTIFKGSGKATLNYGNCYSTGVVKVYVNNFLRSKASANVKHKMVTFEYSKGDVLKILEINTAIIKLNSLELDCRGTKQ